MTTWLCLVVLTVSLVGCGADQAPSRAQPGPDDLAPPPDPEDLVLDDVVVGGGRFLITSIREFEVFVDGQVTERATTDAYVTVVDAADGSRLSGPTLVAEVATHGRTGVAPMPDGRWLGIFTLCAAGECEYVPFVIRDDGSAPERLAALEIAGDAGLTGFTVEPSSPTSNRVVVTKQGPTDAGVYVFDSASQELVLAYTSNSGSEANADAESVACLHRDTLWVLSTVTTGGREPGRSELIRIELNDSDGSQRSGPVDAVAGRSDGATCTDEQFTSAQSTGAAQWTRITYGSDLHEVDRAQLPSSGGHPDALTGVLLRDGRVVYSRPTADPTPVTAPDGRLETLTSHHGLFVSGPDGPAESLIANDIQSGSLVLTDDGSTAIIVHSATTWTTYPLKRASG